MANSLYDVLEVIPTASGETIHAAYRSLITRYHPDKVAALGPELQAVASARTKEINFAYDILSDVASRARYDEELRGEGLEAPVAEVPGPRPNDPAARDFSARDLSARDFAVLEPAGRGPVAGQRSAAAAAPRDRHPLATLAAAVVGVALVLTLPPAANIIFSAVEYSLTGQARFFYEADTPVDAKGDFSSASYLLVLWGWLFANYLFGLVSYRVAVLTGETAAEQFGGSFAATNDRLFLFMTFVCVVAVGELLFAAHTMGDMLAGMFILAGAYLAERGITPPAVSRSPRPGSAGS
jgi:curved DNA-binding protein CbpA